MMRATLGFLTRIPIGKGASIEEIASSSYLFPVAALAIALPLTLLSYLLFRYLDGAIAAIFTLIALYLFTGLLHLDGVADFFDGMMAGGGKERRIRAMKDANIGIAGLFASFVILISNFIAIKGASEFIYPALLIAEVSAKLGMNTCMIAGRRFEPGWGTGALFIESCTPVRYLTALACSFIIVSAATFFMPHTFVIGMFSLCIGITLSTIVSIMGAIKFGTVSGDMMGAANEITRTAVLLIWAIFMV